MYAFIHWVVGLFGTFKFLQETIFNTVKDSIHLKVTPPERIFHGRITFQMDELPFSMTNGEQANRVGGGGQFLCVAESGFLQALKMLSEVQATVGAQLGELAADCGGTATAVSVTTHDNLVHMEAVDSEFESSEKTWIIWSTDVGDVAPGKDFTRKDTQTPLTNTGVGARDE